MVCTKDTGILFVAIELAICPPTWKNARGAVVTITCLLGNLNPPCSPGIALPTTGIHLESTPSVTHQPATNPNCTIVRVTGRGKALRMLLDEVFDSAEARYLQTRRRNHRSAPEDIIDTR